MKNIMYRKVNGKICGVLMDYDLSSWTEKLTSDYAKTSQQRTGTPPFMAYELLKPDIDMLHLYRHDLESLFYIMLILATHYEVQAPGEGSGGGIGLREELPCRKWFDQQSYDDLSLSKEAFLKRSDDQLNLSPTFQVFGGWLESLRTAFRVGLRARDIYLDKRKAKKRMTKGFDYETLGGHVCYSALINPVAKFKGTPLGGLKVRYRGATSTTSAKKTTV